MVVLLNTLNEDRFDRIECENSINGQQFEGICMTPQMGKTCFDQAFLQKSATSDKIEMFANQK